METYTIHFLPHDKKIRVAAGETLIRAAIEAGVHVNASCGGEGVCAKCRVIVENGAVDGGISERLSQEDLDKGYRLACQSVVTGDTTVRVPVTTAVLGGEAQVETLDGQVGIKIPSGTPAGRVFRLRGKGLPRLGAGGKRGDLLASLAVDLPSTLSPRQRELFEELRGSGV